jgi:hypothetical protein
MIITASQARTQLITNPSAYATPEALRALVAQIDARATGLTDLFFSSPNGAAKNKINGVRLHCFSLIALIYSSAHGLCAY